MMAGAAHDPVFAKKVGIPQKTAKEFNMADKRSGFLKSAMRAKGPAYQEGGSVGDASKLIDDIDKEAADAAKKRADDAKKRAARKPGVPRSDARNPDRSTLTPKVHEKPPQFAKGGAVRGAGAAKRGVKPAKFY